MMKIKIVDLFLNIFSSSYFFLSKVISFKDHKFVSCLSCILVSENPLFNTISQDDLIMFIV